MQQIKLDTFDPSYASSDPRDLSEGEVWFTTIYEETMRGQCFNMDGFWWFEGNGNEYTVAEVLAFTPVTVDL